MASLNKVELIGNLGKDPELRYMPSGDAVANVSIATTEKWKDKEGNKKESTEWHRVVFFGKLAEVVGEYLKKGSQIYVEGRLKTRKWQNKDGVDQYTTEINADTMLMLGGAKNHVESSESGSPSEADGSPKYSGSPADWQNDVPF